MSEFWDNKIRTALEKVGRRYYGNTGTIHSNQSLDVEVDKNGRVVSVWFRCQPLPFKQAVASDNRAKEMNNMYKEFKTELHGVDVKNDE